MKKLSQLTTKNCQRWKTDDFIFDIRINPDKGCQDICAILHVIASKLYSL